MDDAFFDIPSPAAARLEAEDSVRRTQRGQALKARAIKRREQLLTLVECLAEGGRLSPRESLDLVMALIEDAHSADPVLFGMEAADHFARLHQARRDLDKARRRDQLRQALVPAAGIEPATSSLQNWRSTN